MDAVALHWAWRGPAVERVLLAWLLLWLWWAPVPLGSQGEWAQGLLAIGMALGVAGLATLRWWEGHSPLRWPGPAGWPLLCTLLLGAALALWAVPAGVTGRYAATTQAMGVLTILGAGVLTVSLVTTPRRAQGVLAGLAAGAAVQLLVAAWMSSQPGGTQWFFLALPGDGAWRGSYAHPAQWATGTGLSLAAAVGLGWTAQRARANAAHGLGPRSRTTVAAAALMGCAVPWLAVRHAGIDTRPLWAAVSSPGGDLATWLALVTWLAPALLSLPRLWRGLRPNAPATHAGLAMAAALALFAMAVNCLVGAAPPVVAHTLVCTVLLMLLWSPAAATAHEAPRAWQYSGETSRLLRTPKGWGSSDGLGTAAGQMASDIEQPGRVKSMEGVPLSRPPFLQQPQRTPLPALWGRASALALVAMLLTLVLLQAWHRVAADLGSIESRQKVARWKSQAVPVPEPEWTAAQAQLFRALGQTPDNPALWEALADLVDLEVRPNFGDAALASPPEDIGPVALRTRVIEARPEDGLAWARLAQAELRAHPRGADWTTAWREAHQRSSADPAVQQLLLQIAMARWSGAAPDIRTWVQAQHLKASPPERDAIERVGRPAGIRWVGPTSGVE